MFSECLIKTSTVYPDDTSNENQRHGWHRHHTVVHITGIVNGLRQNLEAQQRAKTKEFTNGTYDDQNHRIADTVGNTVEE